MFSDSVIIFNTIFYSVSIHVIVTVFNLVAIIYIDEKGQQYQNIYRDSRPRDDS